ncbi:MAG: hypothetical protein M3024_03380 [Candidatus Dormibacteraeota bacterium]|nr:hypothetical protein [Candidatus Dormibacteraeota bacterium]
MNLIPPWLVIEFVLWLGLSALLYAVWPYGRRAVVPALIGTAAGLAVGQGWVALGLPGVSLGDAGILPGVVLAALLQPLAERLPRPWMRRPP